MSTINWAIISVYNIQIISGGQSGVDRAALDFAMDKGLRLGGWCPKGRLAEDGRISERYPLKEARTNIYAERTRLNVEDSDGTLVIFQDELTGGSQYTAEYALSQKKPLMLVRAANFKAIPAVVKWLDDNQVHRLNVAGPRESTAPGIYQAARAFLEKLFPV